MKLLRREHHKYIAVTNNKLKVVISDPLSEDILINRKKVDIRVEKDPSGLTFLVWKNKRYQVEIAEKSQNKYEIWINGVSFNVSVETPISYKRKKYLEKHKSKSKFELIKAPMPGKIVDILVEENKEIRVGDPVLILEAMKMQNEISSTVNGIVKSIKVVANASVMKDDLLVEIEL
jgi:glutaconyl-CoA/methylmalonyl-CoA decarboxylase subunit gamma